MRFCQEINGLLQTHHPSLVFNNLCEEIVFEKTSTIKINPHVDDNLQEKEANLDLVFMSLKPYSYLGRLYLFMWSSLPPEVALIKKILPVKLKPHPEIIRTMDTLLA